MKKQSAIAAFAAALALAFLSCSADIPWPSGKVSVLRSAEYLDGAVKYAAIQYSVTNEGDTVIRASNVGFMISTNKVSYSATFRKEVNILPGKTIFLQASIPYYTSAEIMTPNSVVVLDSFFE